MMGSDRRLTLRESYVATTAPGTGQYGLPSKVIQFLGVSSFGLLAVCRIYGYRLLRFQRFYCAPYNHNGLWRTTTDDFKNYSVVAGGLMCLDHTSRYASSDYQDALNCSELDAISGPGKTNMIL